MFGSRAKPQKHGIGRFIKAVSNKHKVLIILTIENIIHPSIDPQFHNVFVQPTHHNDDDESTIVTLIQFTHHPFTKQNKWCQLPDREVYKVRVSRLGWAELPRDV